MTRHDQMRVNVCAPKIRAPHQNTRRHAAAEISYTRGRIFAIQAVQTAQHISQSPAHKTVAARAGAPAGIADKLIHHRRLRLTVSSCLKYSNQRLPKPAPDCSTAPQRSLSLPSLSFAFSPPTGAAGDAIVTATAPRSRPRRACSGAPRSRRNAAHRRILMAHRTSSNLPRPHLLA